MRLETLQKVDEGELYRLNGLVRKLFSDKSQEALAQIAAFIYCTVSCPPKTSTVEVGSDVDEAGHGGVALAKNGTDKAFEAKVICAWVLFPRNCVVSVCQAAHFL